MTELIFYNLIRTKWYLLYSDKWNLRTEKRIYFFSHNYNPNIDHHSLVFNSDDLNTRLFFLIFTNFLRSGFRGSPLDSSDWQSEWGSSCCRRASGKGCDLWGQTWCCEKFKCNMRPNERDCLVCDTTEQRCL